LSVREVRERTPGLAEAALRNLPAWIARDIVRHKLTVLNWGCAEGDTTDALARALGTSVTGVDSADSVIDLARRRFPHRRFSSSTIDEIETHDVLFMSSPLKRGDDVVDVVEPLLARTRKYALVLVPVREGRQRDERAPGLDGSTIPGHIGEFVLLSWAVADPAIPPPSSSAEQQVLAVYANRNVVSPEWQQSPGVAPAFGDDRDVWRREALERGHAEVEAAQVDLLQKQHALIARYQTEIADLNARISRWNQQSGESEARSRAIEEGRAEMVEAQTEFLQKQDSVIRSYQREIAELNARINGWRQQWDEWEAHLHAVAHLQATTSEVVRTLKDAADDLRTVAKTQPYRIAHLLRRCYRDLVRGSWADRKAAVRWLRKRLVGRQLPSPQAKNPLLDTGIVLLSMSAQLQEAEVTAFATAVHRNPQSYHDVICFSAIEWTSRFQRPQQLMSQFANAGHRVFYISRHFHADGPPYELAEVAANIYQVSLRTRPLDVYSDRLDDAARDDLFAALDALRREQGIGAAFSCVHLPFWWRLVDHLRTKLTWPVVYDCMDYRGSASSHRQELLDAEDRLLAEADLLVVSSLFLEDQAGRHNPRRLLLRNGCDYGRVVRLAGRRRPGDGIRPVIGYCGTLTSPFDADVLAQLAARRPDWDFVVVGSTSTDDIARLIARPNITLLEEPSYATMSQWRERFDVAIIPFQRLPLSVATNPVEGYEILAAGKPTAAAPLPDVPVTVPEFEREIATALEKTGEVLVEPRLVQAHKHTWHERFGALAPAVRGTFPLASIVIITYNNLSFSRLCLQSLYAHTEWPNFEVVVVDNASTDGTREYLKEAERQFPQLRVVLNDTNRGFAAANNIGLQVARGEYLVLLNNDTVLVRGWLSTLIRHLATNDTIGLIGPVTNETCNEARVAVGYRQLKEMPAWAAEFARQYDGHIFDIPMLAMYCVAMRRAIFAEIGPLDEQFGIGLFEDDDYSMRMRKRGYRVVCAADAFVYHFGCASFRKLKESGKFDRLFAENRRRFEAKWNVVWTPHQRGALQPAAPGRPPA
jgi:GT2 family glycosyltransferase/glycosyltransferase involved in cell wall biosynthesis